MRICTSTPGRQTSAPIRSSRLSPARRRRSAWPTAVFAACAVALSAAGGVRYVSYAEARPTVDALRDVLPADLQGKAGAPLEAAWSTWVSAHDRDIRAR